MTAQLDLDIEGEPELVFQPAIDLATGRLLGFEALLRWNDPVEGSIAPSVLIPWAEEHGRMTDLNAWVMSEACTRAAEWGSDVQVAVNCAVSQLRRREAAEAVARALAESGLNPDRLTIEVTEASVTDPAAAAELHVLSRLGIQLTVDDIGSDWSTLENVQQFAINTMKIDGSLVEGLEHPEGVNQAIVETIIRVSHTLGICPVAEAVETAGQVSILRGLGADVAQGYFFAAPLSVDETRAFTADRVPAFDLAASLGTRAQVGPDTWWDTPPDAASETAVAPAPTTDELDDAPLDAFMVTGDISLVSRRGRIPAAFRRGKHSAAS